MSAPQHIQHIQLHECDFCLSLSHLIHPTTSRTPPKLAQCLSYFFKSMREKRWFNQSPDSFYDFKFSLAGSDVLERIENIYLPFWCRSTLGSPIEKESSLSGLLSCRSRKSKLYCHNIQPQILVVSLIGLLHKKKR